MVRFYVELQGSAAARVPLLVCTLLGVSSAGQALLRALAVPRDLTGTIQGDRHYSTGTIEGSVLYQVENPSHLQPTL